MIIFSLAAHSRYSIVSPVLRLALPRPNIPGIWVPICACRRGSRGGVHSQGECAAVVSWKSNISLFCVLTFHRISVALYISDSESVMNLNLMHSDRLMRLNWILSQLRGVENRALPVVLYWSKKALSKGCDHLGSLVMIGNAVMLLVLSSLLQPLQPIVR